MTPSVILAHAILIAAAVGLAWAAFGTRRGRAILAAALADRYTWYGLATGLATGAAFWAVMWALWTLGRYHGGRP